jgi:predicted alpha/beta superfamily hydrolase
LISLFAGYWRPETFARIGLLSTSFWYESVITFEKEHTAPEAHMRIFMSVGTCEGIYKHSAQQNMVQYMLEARTAWIEKGFPPERLRFVTEEGGTHDALFMIKRFPEALMWLFGHPGGNAVPTALANYVLPGSKQLVMHAARTGREYRIFIASPTAPPPEGGYPVLYALDGNASFGSLTEAMRLQSRPPHGIEPVVIVSIGYDSEDPIVTDRRFYDYTERADSSELPPRPDGSAWPETGGAEHFLAFIEEELKPAVEGLFPIDRERQALFGHSLGGLFAMHVLFTRPASFSSYIAGSPSVWWKNYSLLKRWPVLEKQLQRGEINAGLLIGIGSEEKLSIVEGAQRVYSLLLPYRRQGLNLAFRQFEGEGHVSVIPPLISLMLRFIATNTREASK